MNLLPKIVVTSTEFKEGILKNSTESLDPEDIVRLWKVFHSIKRYIFDPTAKSLRLENFWWRIWGCKQKNQSGVILADLFCRIIDQPSRFGLDRLASSDENFSNLKSKNGSLVELEAQRKYSSVISTELTAKYSQQKISNTTGTIPHPILKKTRGPSNNSRPTARFISPHETEDEHPITPVKHKSTFYSASNTNSEIKLDRKRVSGPIIPKKKGAFVSPRKKQSVARRQSSHSSSDAFGRILGNIQTGTKSSSIIDKISPHVLQTLARRNSRLENPSAISDGKSRNSLMLRKSKSSSRNNINLSPKYSDTILQNHQDILTRARQEINVSDEYYQARDSLDECNSKCQANFSFSRTIQPFGLHLNLLGKVESHYDEPTLGNGCSPFSEPKQHSIGQISENMRESNQKNFSLYEVDPQSLPQSKIFKPVMDSNMIDDMKNQKHLNSDATTQQVMNPDKPEASKSRVEGQMSATIFAKRPIQVAISSSTSTDQLSRSKSQLTLLLERDHSSIGEKSQNHGKDGF